MVAHVAKNLGVRVLFLKGPVATIQGLRDPGYVSGDVDALCEPGQEQALIDALCSQGWSPREQSEAATRFTTHSITLVHQDWPCDIDVHSRFPGFLAQPTAVFEALWARRELATLANVQVYGPDYPAQCLVILLHGLRSPSLPKNQSELEGSRQRFSAMSEDDLAAVFDLVESTGAAEVVYDFFADLGVSIAVAAVPSAEYLRWRLITQPSRAEGWAMAISDTRGAERWRLMFRAIFPQRRHLIIDHPIAAQSTRAAARVYVARWTRAARLLPAAIHNVVMARHARESPLEQAGSSPLPVASRRPATPDMHKSKAAARSHDRFPDTDSAASCEVGRALAVYTADATTAGVEGIFVLPLGSGATQVPIRVNAVGYELLTLLLASEGDLDHAVRDAAELFAKAPDEVRPVIQEFRWKMVRLGVLTA